MAPPRRRRPSTIDRLDPEIKDLIGKLRIDFGWTIDEILKKLRELGQGDVSRSALGRHILSIEETGAQLRMARETAQALVHAAGDGHEDRVADLNIELCQAMILRMMTAIDAEGDGQPVTFKPMEIMLITKALQQVAGAKKTNTDLVLRVRKEATEAAAKKAGDTARALGLSADGVAAIRHAVLGA